MLASVTGGVDTDQSMATLFMAAAEDDFEVIDAIVAIAIVVREDDIAAGKRIPSAHPRGDEVGDTVRAEGAKGGFVIR